MTDLTRRNLLRLTAGLGSATLLSGCGDGSWRIGSARASNGRDGHPSYVYFTPAEVAFVDAAVARLIPTDALGPGAAEAGVTVFIDRQLKGPYGQAVDWYMAGPWADGTEQQGYQLRLTPAQLYRDAIRAIDDHCRKTFDQKPFAALSTDDQDSLLHDLEQGHPDLKAAHGKPFFQLLWQNTQEGYFADPLYEGNRGFAGWNLVGFPGPRYNYVDDIRRYGQPYPLATVGLLGRDPSRRLGSTS